MPTCDFLALARTAMANERTLLANIRTGMTFIVTGAGIIRFVDDGLIIVASGSSLIIVGICFMVWGVWRFRRNKNYLKKMPLSLRLPSSF